MNILGYLLIILLVVVLLKDYRSVINDNRCVFLFELRIWWLMICRRRSYEEYSDESYC